MNNRNLWSLCRIAKQYHFSAAHKLTKVPPNHPCARLHGHNYMVEVEIRNEIGPNGFCGSTDFMTLDDMLEPILSELDHSFLNDIEGLENPTAEIIAYWILGKINPQIVYSVKLWETPKSWAMAINQDGMYHKSHRND